MSEGSSFVKDLVVLRHRKSMSDYLRDGRENTLHVTDLVYGCPRYAKWVYEFRKANELDDVRNLSERDMTVFVVGKKLDELCVGDFHHVKMRGMYGGLELVGEIDDLIIDSYSGIVVVIDKKHLRSRPPREAHSHYVSQVNIYAYMLSGNECIIESCEVGDVEQLRELVSDIDDYRIFGAILYIDVSLESNQISDVVVWEIDKKTVEAMKKFVREMVSKISENVPEPYLSWFCNYCPFFRRCADTGVVVK